MTIDQAKVGLDVQFTLCEFQGSSFNPLRMQGTISKVSRDTNRISVNIRFPDGRPLGTITAPIANANLS